MPMSQNVFSVTDLVSLIKQTLEFNDSLRAFYVKGEISNFTAHRNGHWYFSIKDENAKMSCVMFKSYASSVDFNPKEGDQVLLRASISVYALSGSVQCNVFSMQNVGLGNLFIQYEKLKKKLYEEGLFDQTHKQNLPKFPQRIALVTGGKSAALQDMFKMAHLRWPMVELILYETLVQGNQAAPQIIKSLKEADQNNCDLIILARGGGSIEDLWAFNDEQLAYCIYNLKTPIITGVGHESDTTIVDFVADVRAATPTQAMSTALPDINEISDSIKSLSKQLNRSINNRLDISKHQLKLIKQQSFAYNPEFKTNQYRIHLDLLRHKMINSAQDVSPLQKQLENTTQRLVYIMNRKNDSYRSQMNILELNINAGINSKLDKSKEAFRHTLALINAYSPLNSLERGYSLSYKNNSLIQSINDVEAGDELKIRLKDGFIKTTVNSKEET